MYTLFNSFYNYFGTIWWHFVNDLQITLTFIWPYTDLELKLQAYSISDINIITQWVFNWSLQLLIMIYIIFIEIWPWPLHVTLTLNCKNNVFNGFLIPQNPILEVLHMILIILGFNLWFIPLRLAAILDFTEYGHQSEIFLWLHDFFGSWWSYLTAYKSSKSFPDVHNFFAKLPR